MEEIITTLASLYDTVGFNGLLEALDTCLVRRWDTYRREPLTAEAARQVEREIARLRKARRPLTDTERAELQAQGLFWWSPAT